MARNEPVHPARLGANLLQDGNCEFVVWAPRRKQMEVRLLDDKLSAVPMERDAFGYWRAAIKAQAGAKYFYKLDRAAERPDPASRFQPEGVHGPSEIVDVGGFEWTDANWKGFPLKDTVLYELHVGSYTREGTFAALTPCLNRLADLGVNTIELMPIAQFPGSRNWGYDGVHPYAVQNSYGSPRDLQTFVNAAHGRGLAVALDVVYNHLGPEGNYLGEFGPYFTNHYHTPWGDAVNFDGPDSGEVRHFFVQNALYWLKYFHFDALRLDAIHGIFDASAIPFLAELSAAVESLSVRVGRKLHLIAESDQNDARVLRPIADGGFGMEAVWSDDFHHSVHALLTREKSGYYADFGEVRQLSSTLKNGWCYAGQYSCYRRRKHGNTPPRTDPSRFVVFTQNHDQVGNRAFGERLSQLASFEALKLAAGITLLSHFTPLLFMGEEYGETAPFQYFTSHSDAELAEAVRRGRKSDFQSFAWAGDVPDPQAKETFLRSKLNHALAEEEPHRTLLNFYKTLLRFRCGHALANMPQQAVVDYESSRAVQIVRGNGRKRLAMLFHFGDVPADVSVELPRGSWEKRIDSADLSWLGPGASLLQRLQGGGEVGVKFPPHSFAVFELASEGPE